MNYINADLRKNNLAENIADRLANIAEKVKSSLVSAVNKSLGAKVKPRIEDASDYYRQAGVRGNPAPSIERELAAQGNAW